MAVSFSRHAFIVLFLLVANTVTLGADAQASLPTVEADGTITTAAGKIPFSSAASKEALKRFKEIVLEDRSSPGVEHPLESRKFYDNINRDRAERMKKLFPIDIVNRIIDGVPVAIVRPKSLAKDDRRVLINLHGGAFLWGAGSGGLVEAIPVASVSKITVITVDYREGPENQFPAATDDVEKVYKAALEHHDAESIGIYGCSAGGGLTAQVIARLQDDHLPMPGAIGVFCAGVWNGVGDSNVIASLLMGKEIVSSNSKEAPKPHPYFQGPAFEKFAARFGVPGALDSVLAKFPATLLISGTRDSALSETLVTNETLIKAGVPVELHVWEGMWHSFFSDPELPESRAAYDVIARFFDHHLKAPAKR